MPSRSADAIRASSRRRSVRAAAIARTGSACRPADATSARANPSGSTSSSFGPVGSVGVLLDHLRRPHQQIGHVRRRSQHVHQPLRHRALVAQRRQIPPLVGQFVADPAVRQQARVRIGRVRQPVQQRRQQHLLHPTAPTARRRSARPGASARSADPRIPVRRADVRPPPASCIAENSTPDRPTRAAADRRAWRAAATPGGSAA